MESIEPLAILGLILSIPSLCVVWNSLAIETNSDGEVNSIPIEVRVELFK
jgi:hypothetical protein